MRSSRDEWPRNLTAEPRSRSAEVSKGRVSVQDHARRSIACGLIFGLLSVAFLRPGNAVSPLLSVHALVGALDTSYNPDLWTAPGSQNQETNFTLADRNGSRFFKGGRTAHVLGGAPPLGSRVDFGVLTFNRDLGVAPRPS